MGVDTGGILALGIQHSIFRFIFAAFFPRTVFCAASRTEVQSGEGFMGFPDSQSRPNEVETSWTSFPFRLFLVTMEKEWVCPAGMFPDIPRR